ncbi:hypothetical protein CERZMDRAFT_122825 [Cercospora zeae-maydis SCOH1-5]|uniref:Uncharacterized protein n=1 Tax=Cercospora zeae-maydis SCOH1-5 TaxID=717836 RepID=A0A6A6F0L5_9PEZI|nr:hypothetical protein CERZMDRAFT_122825 [Cercospora zeae-maydis SCOH1-5]
MSSAGGNMPRKATMMTADATRKITFSSEFLLTEHPPATFHAQPSDHLGRCHRSCGPVSMQESSMIIRPSPAVTNKRLELS